MTLLEQVTAKLGRIKRRINRGYLLFGTYTHVEILKAYVVDSTVFLVDERGTHEPFTFEDFLGLEISAYEYDGDFK